MTTSLNRKLALAVLRDPKSEQDFGTIGDERAPYTTKACAGGHIWRLVLAREPNARYAHSVFDTCAEWLEIPYSAMQAVMARNDSLCCTLPQIANFLEEVFDAHPCKPTEAAHSHRALPHSLTSLLTSPTPSPTPVQEVATKEA